MLQMIRALLCFWLVWLACVDLVAGEGIDLPPLSPAAGADARSVVTVPNMPRESFSKINPHDKNSYEFCDAGASDFDPAARRLAICVKSPDGKVLRRENVPVYFDLLHYNFTVEFLPARCVLGGYVTSSTMQVMLLELPSLRIDTTFLCNGASLSPSGKYLLLQKMIPHFSDPLARVDMVQAVRTTPLEAGKRGRAAEADSVLADEYAPEQVAPLTMLFPRANAEAQYPDFGNYAESPEQRHRHIFSTIWEENKDVACVVELYNLELYALIFDFRNDKKVRVTVCPLGFGDVIRKLCEAAGKDKCAEEVIWPYEPLMVRLKGDVLTYEYAPERKRGEEQELARRKKATFVVADFSSYVVLLP